MTTDTATIVPGGIPDARRRGDATARRRSPRAPAVPPAGAGKDAADAVGDIVDEWGRQSFPASDPPANW